MGSGRMLQGDGDSVPLVARTVPAMYIGGSRNYHGFMDGTAQRLHVRTRESDCLGSLPTISLWIVSGK